MSHPLLHRHLNWKHLKMCLTQGFDARFHPFPEETRIKDLNEAVVRGNHQSAILHSDVLISNVKKEIRTGFQFPLRIDETFKIKGAIVVTLGMVVQSTLDIDGNTAPTHLPTDDQSFDFSE